MSKWRCFAKACALDETQRTRAAEQAHCPQWVPGRTGLLRWPLSNADPRQDCLSYSLASKSGACQSHEVTAKDFSALPKRQSHENKASKQKPAYTFNFTVGLVLNLT